MKVVKKKEGKKANDNSANEYNKRKIGFENFQKKVRAIMTSKRNVSSLQFFGVDGIDTISAMVGRPQEVFDVVVKGLKVNKDVFTICDAAMRYVKEERRQERMFSKLTDEGTISKQLYEMLDKNQIFNLEQLAAMTKKEVKNLSGIGKKNFETLCAVMVESELLFKCERDEKK